MTEYRMKTGKIGEKVVKTAKKVEDAFVDTFLEEDENNPSGYSMKTGKMAERATSAYKKIEDTIVGGYKKIEDTVVGGYKKIEDTVVGGYKKIENAFVDTFLEKVEEEEAAGLEEQADGESHPGAEESTEE